MKYRGSTEVAAPSSGKHGKRRLPNIALLDVIATVPSGVGRLGLGNNPSRAGERAKERLPRGRLNNDTTSETAAGEGTPRIVVAVDPSRTGKAATYTLTAC